MSPTDPYFDEDGQPILRDSFFAFTDILGFQQVMRAAHRDNREHELLGKLTSVMHEVRSVIDSRVTSNAFKGEVMYWQYKFFTDNLVIGYPIYGDTGESEFGDIISMLQWTQLLMAQRGLFLRGGLGYGKVHVGPDIVIGMPLLNAYEVEQNVARWPRIVLCEEVMEKVTEHLSYYADRSWAPQNRELLVDSDGEVFVNYLEAAWVDWDVVLWDAIARHKNAVERGLDDYQDEEDIRKKYTAVAQYHNYFCRMFRDHLGYRDQYRIDRDFPPISIRRLSD